MHIGLYLEGRLELPRRVFRLLKGFAASHNFELKYAVLEWLEESIKKILTCKEKTNWTKERQFVNEGSTAELNHASDSTFLFVLTKESVIKSQCCGHHHQIKIVNRFPCVIETLNFPYYLKKGTWCQSHRLGVIKLWYLSLAMWGNNLSTSLSPIWPIFYPHPNLSVASHYLMNNFQTPMRGLHPALPLQTLPLSLFSHAPSPCPYLTSGGYLNYYTHPLCVFLLYTLGLVNLSFPYPKWCHLLQQGFLISCLR